MNALDKTIVAIDQMTLEEAHLYLEKHKGQYKTIKIGLELFCAYGSKMIKEFALDLKLNLFLDLKLHDIPNTVKKSIEALKGLPLNFLTVHLSGGRAMLEEANKAAFIHLPGCQILGVSLLTSLDHQDTFEIWGMDEKERQKQFVRLFELAAHAKVPGLILPAMALPMALAIEQKEGRAFVKVCPGIRFSEEIEASKVQDQKNALTPKKAFELGADYLVIGRSLTQASEDQINSRLNHLQSMGPV